MKKGKLYGIGVGPGDPELITLKASRIINETEYIAIPGSEKEETRSYQIASKIIEKPDSKKLIYCPVTMTKDRALLDKMYEAIAEKIIQVLDKGFDVSYLTIGDPTIYATYMYIHRLIEKAGYEAEIINGIPSFCAVAARLDISLCEREEKLHIIPSSYDIDEALMLDGVKVLMKAGSKIKDVKQQLEKKNADVYMVENCGFENERVFKSVHEIDENAGYLSVVIVKE